MRLYGGGKMPVPARFERPPMECEQCDKSLPHGGIAVMYKGNMVRLCVECAVARLNEKRGFDDEQVGQL